MTWKTFWSIHVPKGKKPANFQTVLNLFDGWLKVRDEA